LIYSPCVQTWRLSHQPFRSYDCGHRNWKWLMWPDHALFQWFVTHKPVFQCTCVQNLTILPSAMPVISLWPTNLKWVTPLLMVICYSYTGTWHSAHVCKRFSHSWDMVGVHQNLIGLCDLTMTLLRMVCHP